MMGAFPYLFASLALTSLCASFPRSARCDDDNNNDNNNNNENDNNDNLHLLLRDIIIHKETTSQSNRFVDELLDMIRPQLKDKYDPAILPEAGFAISRKVLLVTITGEVKMYDGWLAGVSTLRRMGDAHVVKTTGSSTTGCLVTMDAHLGVANLVGHYKAHAKFMNLGPSFDVTISIPSIAFSLSLQQDVNQAGSRPEIAFLDIEHVGHVDIKLRGPLGALDWIVGKVSSFVGNVIKGVVANLLQSPIRNLLSEKLATSDVTLERFGCDRIGRRKSNVLGVNGRPDERTTR